MIWELIGENVGSIDFTGQQNGVGNAKKPTGIRIFDDVVPDRLWMCCLTNSPQLSDVRFPL